MKEPYVIADKFNEFFVNVGAQNNQTQTSSTTSQVPAREVHESMWLAPVVEEEVARAIRGMKPKHSADLYGMSTWLLKQCNKKLVKPLTKLINLSLTSGHFPSMLKCKSSPIFPKFPHSISYFISLQNATTTLW